MKIFTALNLIFSLTFSLASKDQSHFIEDLNLNFTLKNDQAFPDKFRVKFSEFGENFDFEFVKSTANRGTDNVYVISNGQPTEYTFKSADLYEKYEQISGDGWATLTRYKILNNQLRFIGTVYSTKSQNFAFDIYPVFAEGSSNYTSDSNKHQIKKRSLNSDYSTQNLDYLISPETFAKINRTIRKKTGRVGLDGQPINLYVELLVVTDSSVYDYHRRFIGTDDQSLIFSQMRIYYAHLINGISQRYTNSLMNDPDLKIFIVLKNYLFLTNPADQTWLDVANVGDPNFTTYEGKEVVITDKTLTAFTNFMNSKTFQFSFDHAVALFDKDLWSNDLTASPANRKGVAGFATIGQVCQTNKYSISEDSGGFANSIVIAHELGHNLGSLHDGEVGCDDSLNFIMTPVLSSNPPQTNFYLFSDCSINQFKSVLLNDQLNDVSSTASCLTNIPTSFPAELSLVSLTYPGLIWTANDQCKMQYGPQSSSCPLLINSGSCALFCYPNTTSLSCLSVAGGAVDGTACDLGKICINGECALDQKASNDTCLFGDTILPTNVLVGYQLGLTVNQINCSELFRLGELANHGIDAYCSDPRISTSCCQSCRKYKILACKDNFYDCARYSTLCDNVLLNGAPIWQSCLRSCNRCPNINSVQRCNESNSLCQNGGTCRNTTVSGAIGFECVCRLGYSGQFCETKNPCLSNPCLNGGTCHLLGSSGYTCSCLGICNSFNCEGCINPITTTTTAILVDYCLSNPCQNGAICQNLVGGYACSCLPGYTGQSCEIVINTCSSNPCLNNALCQNSLNSWICRCPPGYTGTRCESIINYCLSNPCSPNGLCVQGVNSYTCNCDIGYIGPNCNIIASPCSSNPCQNNGMCTQISSGSYICICSPGFTGINCQTLINTIMTTSMTTITSNACLSIPCKNGGSCQQIVNGYNCNCPNGFTGLNCNIQIDYCASAPCLNGGLCQQIVNGYNCSCPEGFSGPNCNIIVDSCSSRPCLNNGLCVNSGLTYSCLCLPGYTGFNCQNLLNVCQPDPCNGQGICNQLGTSFQCTCNFGFSGTNCELIINPCTQNPCVRGNCSSASPGTYRCTCPCDFTGTNCQTQINFCSINPCINGGACQNSGCGLICICPNGFTGSRCETRFSFCDSFPCFGGATCVDQIFGYTCTCPTGFTGLNCDIQINNCDSSPCLNGGSCLNTLNSYVCACPNSFTGLRCEFRINNCISQPCQNNGTCNEITNGYACLCPAGYTGNNCQTFINYCLSLPCQNGGSCLSIVNGYNCICPEGYSGPNCNIIVDPCSSRPCLNNGLCVNTGLTYSCLCLPGYTGFNCQNLIDVSSSSTSTTTLPATTTTTTITTTTTTSTTSSTFSISTSTQKKCEDIDEFYCKSLNSFLATNCENRNFYIKGFKINDFCCKTCQQLEKNCFDSNIDCKFLGNFCNILDSYNPHPCRATCNRC